MRRAVRWGGALAARALLVPLAGWTAEVAAIDLDGSAAEGRSVFLAQCAACHGPEGLGFTGPAIIGPDAALGVYGNAQKLFHYISTVMPQNRPGSLSEREYRQVLAFLLVENGYIDPDRPLGPEELPEITLRRE